jgi:hypothetical protein
LYEVRDTGQNGLESKATCLPQPVKHGLRNTDLKQLIADNKTYFSLNNPFVKVVKKVNKIHGNSLLFLSLKRVEHIVVKISLNKTKLPLISLIMLIQVIYRT